MRSSDGGRRCCEDNQRKRHRTVEIHSDRRGSETYPGVAFGEACACQLSNQLLDLQLLLDDLDALLCGLLLRRGHVTIAAAAATEAAAAAAVRVVARITCNEHRTLHW